MSLSKGGAGMLDAHACSRLHASSTGVSSMHSAETGPRGRVLCRGQKAEQACSTGVSSMPSAAPRLGGSRISEARLSPRRPAQPVPERMRMGLRYEATSPCSATA